MSSNHLILMKKLLLIALISLPYIGSSQKKKVEFQIKKGKNKIVFKGINKSDFDQEVVLYFNKISGLYGYSSPIKKTIPAKSKIEFLELRFNGKYSYNYSFRNKSTPTLEQQKAYEAKLQRYKFKEEDSLLNGIVLFSKDGCSRCKITQDYLMQNNVDFKIINISESKSNNDLMWKTIRDNGEKINSVPTPVVLVNGEVKHSFKNLNKFLKSLKKRFK